MLRLRLTRGFFRTAQHVTKPGSTTRSRISDVLDSLQREPVPGPDDVEDMLPPVLRCWARRVPGTSLVVLFRRNGDDVAVLGVKVSAEP